MTSVMEMKSMSDNIMSLKLDIEGVMLNVVRVYAPWVGCHYRRKKSSGVSWMKW